MLVPFFSHYFCAILLLCDYFYAITFMPFFVPLVSCHFSSYFSSIAFVFIPFFYNNSCAIICVPSFLCFTFLVPSFLCHHICAIFCPIIFVPLFLRYTPLAVELNECREYGEFCKFSEIVEFIKIGEIGSAGRG